MGRAGHEGDFSAYTVVRWPAMLRTLVLLGCPRAAQVVQEGLARCYRRWGELLDSDDPDVRVYRELLETWHRSAGRERRGGARRAWGSARSVLPLPEPAPVGRAGAAVATDTADTADAADTGETAADVLPELTEAVAALAPAQRAVVVLRFTAHLEDVQVADVLDLDVAVVAQEARSGLTQLGRERLERLERAVP